MSSHTPSRRRFLQASGLLAASYYVGARTAVAGPRSPGDRLRIGAIGMRYQGSVIAEKAQEYGDIVAICDVDREIAEKAREQFGGQAPLYEDYRDLLARDDVDVVTIGSPDHWHAKMLIDACRAGKDVYCEKPLTLTVDEGRHILRAVRETKRVVQIGTWQRSDHNFRLACEMVRAGRIGKLERVEVVLGKNVTGGPFAVQPIPPHLNWDLWQGQTPDTPYIPERCHYTFRWWLEYSGGQMTDWGAHHMDIAHWGMGMEHSGPLEIEGAARWPDVKNGYNVPIDFEARLTYPGGVVLEVKDTGRNGVLFEGTEGRIFVNRGAVAGKPVDDLAANPLPREEFRLYADDNLARPPRTGKLEAIINHMGNFYDCVLSRRTPVSDVVSQHRSVSACHLVNISLRLGRRLRWDPEHERFENDAEADALLLREQRKGFEVG
jgi:myo-inositol 2-dehydrogenase / D-chiro-inositol 1-dehydrogenase